MATGQLTFLMPQLISFM